MVPHISPEVVLNSMIKAGGASVSLFGHRDSSNEIIQINYPNRQYQSDKSSLQDEAATAINLPKGRDRLNHDIFSVT
jgi:hypothetical protein